MRSKHTHAEQRKTRLTPIPLFRRNGEMNGTVKSTRSGGIGLIFTLIVSILFVAYLWKSLANTLAYIQ